MGKGFFKQRSPSSLQATHKKKRFTQQSINQLRSRQFPSSRHPCTSRSRVPCPLRPVLISSNSCLPPSINLNLQPSASSIDYPTALKPTTLHQPPSPPKLPRCHKLASRSRASPQLQCSFPWSECFSISTRYRLCTAPGRREQPLPRRPRVRKRGHRSFQVKLGSAWV
ncbi:uncharacterized protein QC761_104325 [Podospora bellae-mahoneyi]|uniref:Uncharacterized protein n=1 Tax=Podospora bellae-mahoneyi TaxID=2093777 RepID=A0ABR0FUZ6_9PEZI|nr:hypothetical protein QC761_104325 [Podospora bellae-mahoneyi]